MSEKSSLTEYGARSYSIGRRKGKLSAYSLVLKLVQEWDVEACCHGIQQDKLIYEIRELMQNEDMRWKVNKEQILAMCKARREGDTVIKISEEFGISPSQVSYWTNSNYRSKKRAINKLRRFGHENVL